MKPGWYKILETAHDPTNQGNYGAYVDGTWVAFWNPKTCAGQYDKAFPPNLEGLTFEDPEANNGTFYYSKQMADREGSFGEILNDPTKLEFVAPITHDRNGKRVAITKDCKTKLADGWWKINGYVVAIENRKILGLRVSTFFTAFPEFFRDEMANRNPADQNELWSVVGDTDSMLLQNLTQDFYEITSEKAEFLKALIREPAETKMKMQDGWYHIPSKTCPGFEKSVDQRWYGLLVDGDWKGFKATNLTSSMTKDAKSSELIGRHGFFGLNPHSLLNKWLDKLKPEDVRLHCRVATLNGKPLAPKINLPDGWYRLPGTNCVGALIEGRWVCALNLILNPARPEFKEDLTGIRFSPDGYFLIGRNAVSASFIPEADDYTPEQIAQLQFVKPITHAPDGKAVGTGQHTLANGWYRVPGYNQPVHALMLDGQWRRFTDGTGGFHWCHDLGQIPGKNGVYWWSDKISFFGLDAEKFDQQKASNFKYVGQVHGSFQDLSTLKVGWYRMPEPYGDWYARWFEGEWGNLQKLGKEPDKIRVGTPANLSEVFGVGLGNFENCGIKGHWDWKADQFTYVGAITHDYTGKAISNEAQEEAAQVKDPIEFRLKIEEPPGNQRNPAEPISNEGPVKEEPTSPMWLAVPAAGLLLAVMTAKAKAKKQQLEKAKQVEAVKV